MMSKAQVTVPKPVRDYLGLKPWEGVVFERIPSGEVIVRAAKKSRVAKGSRFAKLRGRATIRMKTEEIMALTRGD